MPSSWKIVITLITNYCQQIVIIIITRRMQFIAGTWGGTQCVLHMLQSGSGRQFSVLLGVSVARC